MLLGRRKHVAHVQLQVMHALGGQQTRLVLGVRRLLLGEILLEPLQHRVRHFVEPQIAEHRQDVVLEVTRLGDHRRALEVDPAGVEVRRNKLFDGRDGLGGFAGSASGRLFGGFLLAW